MERPRGISPGGSAPFPGKNVSQHLRNGALRFPQKGESLEIFVQRYTTFLVSSATISPNRTGSILIQRKKLSRQDIDDRSSKKGQVFSRMPSETNMAAFFFDSPRVPGCRFHPRNNRETHEVGRKIMFN